MQGRISVELFEAALPAQLGAPPDNKHRSRMAKLAGGVHRLDGQLMVALDVDHVLELVPKTSFAA